jgi:colanic acid/amylovoran biosynthesis glycosyltransferase
VNTDLFPFALDDCYEVGSNKSTLLGLSAGVWWRLTKRMIFAEQVIRQRNACLIHAHFGPVAWRALSLKRVLGLPLVTTFYGHDMAPELAQQPSWPKRRRELFEQGDLFLVEGPFMRQRLVDLGCPACKVQIQPVAIDLNGIPFRPRLPSADGKVIIMFAGRFCEKKGLLYALEAVRDVRRSGRNVEFRVIGDGPLSSMVRRFVFENDMEDCVRLLGFLDHRAYLCEMDKADIFLHPSVTASNGDSEGGAPTTILEAQAMGMPVVSTYHADIPNVVVPGNSALLTAERDCEGLVRSLASLLDNPSDWAEMGRAGRAHMETCHNIKLEVLSLEDKYLALLNSPATTC